MAIGFMSFQGIKIEKPETQKEKTLNAENKKENNESTKVSLINKKN